MSPASACAQVGSDAPPDFAAPSEPSAEALASKFLAASSVPSCTDILLLAEALLHEAPDLDDRFESGKSVSAGLFFRFKPGARKVCVSHPLSVQAVNRLIRAFAPNHFFSSFVIISGVHSPRHQDSMNARAPNIVIPLSSFRANCASLMPRTLHRVLHSSLRSALTCLRLRSGHFQCQGLPSRGVAITRSPRGVGRLHSAGCIQSGSMS